MKNNFKFLIVLTILLIGCICIGSTFAAESNMDVTNVGVADTQYMQIAHDDSSNDIVPNPISTITPDLSIKCNDSSITYGDLVTVDGEFAVDHKEVNVNGTVFLYDNNTIIANKTINDSIDVKFDNLKLAAGTHGFKLVFISSDEIYGNTNSTVINPTVDKFTSSITVENVTGNVYGQNLTITAKITNGTTGTVTFILNGKGNSGENIAVNKTVDITDGYAIAIFNDAFPASDKMYNVGYNVTVIYNGDENFTNATSDIYRFNITKASINSISIYDNVTNNNTGDIIIVEGQYFKVYGYIDPRWNGNVEVRGDANLYIFKGATPIIGGAKKNIAWTNNTNINHGNYTIDVNTTLAPGIYNISVTFGDGTKNYTSKDSAYYRTLIVQGTPSITVENITGTTYGEDLTVTAKLNYTDATGNVTFVIKDKEGQNITSQTVDVINGTATAIFDPIPIGKDYVVFVKYNGDEVFFTAEANRTFNVLKDVTVTVSANITIEMESWCSFTVTVTLNETVSSGNVTLFIDGVKDQTKDITNNNNTVVFTGWLFTPGKHNITAVFNGNDEYNNASGNVVNLIKRTKATINVNTDGAIYGQNLTITANVTDDNGVPTGNVTFNIIKDGVIIDTQTVDLNATGSAVATFSGLNVGGYSVNCTYNGDENYMNSSYQPIPFNITKAQLDNITINANATNITSGETLKIWGEVSPIISGNVTLVISNGTNVTQDLIDGKYEFNVTGLVPGDYKFYVLYNGNDNYKNAISIYVYVTVNKIVSSITVTNVTGTVYGQTLTVTAKVTDGATGNVTFVINGDVVVANVNASGYAVATFNGLGVGSYNVTAVYNGDELFTNASTKSEFEITKAEVNNVSIDVNSTFVILGETLKVYGSVSPEVSGNVTLYIDGNENATQNLINGGFAFDIIAFTPGNHTFYVIFNGNSNYTAKQSANVTARFGKYDSTIVIYATPSRYVDGETYVLVVVNDTDYKNYPTGKVEVTLNGVKQNITLRKTLDKGVSFGMGVFNGFLPNGTYTVSAKYLGDDLFNPSNASTEISVIKHNTPISIDVKDTVYGNDVVVTAKVDKTATGKIKFTINNITKTADIKNGVATVRFSGLAADKYTVYASYDGDKKFYGNNISKAFKVTKANPTMVVDVTRPIVSVFDSTVVKVDVFDGKTPLNGKVSFSIDGGRTWTDKNLKKGHAEVTFSELPYGTYTVLVKYSGNENYTEAYKNVSFRVIKEDTAVIVNTKDITYGQKLTVSAKVDPRATGKIIFTINGVNKTADIKYGYATATFEGLEAGWNYKVVASYAGDDKFKPNQGEDFFNVYKANPKVTIKADDIDYRENATVTVKVPKDATGTVTFLIDGRFYTVNVTDGVASIEVPGLEAGFYRVDAKYNGDKNYNSAFINDNFIVKQINPEFTMDIEDIDYREVADVVVSLPADAKGFVVYYLNNEFYKVVNVTDGNASFDISGLGAGNYTVGAWYSGDRNYKPMFISENFTVSPIDPNLKGSIESFVYGENGTLILTIDEEAFGNISVDIHGFIYEATIENGTLIIPIDSFDAGDHIAYVIFYSDNENFTGSEIEVPFTIVKADPTINVDVESNMHVDTIVEGDDVIVTVTLPEDATGQVRLSIDGGKTWVYVDVIDGVAHYTFKGLKAGEYTLIAEYLGDNNYNAVSAETTFVVEDAPVSPLVNTMPKAGNPILVLLIALCAIGLESFRRKL